MQYKKGLQIEAGGQRERCSVLNVSFISTKHSFTRPNADLGYSEVTDFFNCGNQVKVCTEVALLAFGLVHLICRATGDVHSLEGMISYVVEKYSGMIRYSY